MKNEFVSYEMALALKELGFDEPCFTYYKNDQLSNILELVKNSEMENVNNEVDNYISAPTFSQAFRFFREKYKLEGAIYRLRFKWASQVFNVETSTYCFVPELFETCEEADIDSLKKMIEIVKNK